MLRQCDHGGSPSRLLYKAETNFNQRKWVSDDDLLWFQSKFRDFEDYEKIVEKFGVRKPIMVSTIDSTDESE